MKKLLTIVITAVMILSGCSASSSSDTSASETTYQSYYDAVLDNTKFQSSSLYYDISAEMSALSDGTYRYYIFLDNAQIAMYEVVMLAVVDGQSYTDSSNMTANIGIFSNSSYNLIPYQSYPEKGFMKGIVISGETNSSAIHIQMIVEWKDRTKEKIRREFLEFDLDQNGYVAGQEVETEESEDEQG